MQRLLSCGIASIALTACGAYEEGEEQTNLQHAQMALQAAPQTDPGLNQAGNLDASEPDQNQEVHQDGGAAPTPNLVTITRELIAPESDSSGSGVLKSPSGSNNWLVEMGLGIQLVDIKSLTLTMVGGGGGGGGGASRECPHRNHGGGGGGGGAGEYRTFVIDDPYTLERLQHSTIHYSIGAAGQGGDGGRRCDDGRSGSNGGDSYLSLTLNDGSFRSFTAKGGFGGQKGGHHDSSDRGDGGLGGDQLQSSALRGGDNGIRGAAGVGGDNGLGHGYAGPPEKAGGRAPERSGGGGGGGGGHVKDYRAYKGGHGGSGMILVTINGSAAM